MSNWKHAYGWIGHLFVSEGNFDGSRHHVGVAIKSETFEAIRAHLSDCKLPKGVEARELGITSTKATPFLAVGFGFSEGFDCYAAVFEAADKAIHRGGYSYRTERAYLKAMLEAYGLELPDPRPMIGCASEHA